MTEAIYSSSMDDATPGGRSSGRGGRVEANSSVDDNEVLALMHRLDPARFKFSVDVVKVSRPRLPSPGSETVRMAVVLWLRDTWRLKLLLLLLLLLMDGGEESPSANED